MSEYTVIFDEDTDQPSKTRLHDKLLAISLIDGLSMEQIIMRALVNHVYFHDYHNGVSTRLAILDMKTNSIKSEVGPL